MVAIVNAAAAYVAAMTWSPASDPKWKPGDGVIDYRTPERRLQKLLKGPERPGAALLEEMEQLRAGLARATADVIAFKQAVTIALPTLDGFGDSQIDAVAEHLEAWRDKEHPGAALRGPADLSAVRTAESARSGIRAAQPDEGRRTKVLNTSDRRRSREEHRRP